MAVNKNFVVKNGIEVNEDLIFASSDLDKVGIGSTIPTTTLDVVGEGIFASNARFSGLTTSQSDLHVGDGGGGGSGYTDDTFDIINAELGGNTTASSTVTFQVIT